MKKAIMIMLMCLVLLGTLPLAPKVTYANPVKGGRFIYEVLDETAESMVRSMKSRGGYKFETKESPEIPDYDFTWRDAPTEEQLVESFKLAMKRTADDSVQVLNGAALNATPVSGAPGWLKATVGTALFITGLDSWLDVYTYLQDYGKVDYTIPGNKTPYVGSRLISVGGYYLTVTDNHVIGSTVYYGLTKHVPGQEPNLFNLKDKSVWGPFYDIGFHEDAHTYSNYNPTIHSPYTFGFSNRRLSDNFELLSRDFVLKSQLSEGYSPIYEIDVDETKVRYEDLEEINWDPDPDPEDEITIYFPDPEVFDTPQKVENEIEDKIEWIRAPHPEEYFEAEPEPTPTPEPSETPLPTYTPLPTITAPPVPTMPPLPDSPEETDALSGGDRTFFEWLLSPITIGIASITGLIGNIGQSLSQGISSIGATLNRIDTKTSKCQCIELPSIYQPWALLLPFLQFLAALVAFMVKVGAFIATIPAVPSQPISNPAFQWFRSATIMGVQIYNVVSTLAAAGLALAIYKIIRSRF